MGALVAAWFFRAGYWRLRNRGDRWAAARVQPVIPVLVTGIQHAQVLGRGRLFHKSFIAPTRDGWVPVTSTGMKA
ncbi:hypothetical protein FHT71_003323 [Rhizobium sp. BK060]|nr:hypothetical protein [Rhizobium sp. BK060]